MAEHGRGGIASCCCSFIFTSGLTALFMWLSLRTSKPTCTIQRFYVPALNKSQNSTSNHTITFDLKLDNGMKDKGVHYDNINLNFSYQNGSALLIANYTVTGFYQGHGKKATRKNLAVDGGAVPWEAAVNAVLNGSTVDFRVDLATRVRYKIMFWNTKRERVVVHGDVEVDSSGEKAKKKKKGVKLKSKSSELRGHWVSLWIVAVFTFLVILLQ
ncbi:hypothetical protein CASFOL_019103 [Castilleja foliolosa]|uniref:Protein NDR1-like n=1 Tax=Castilleja foliolosa TaxID=1961234 RepID=A0ABD3D6G3_9LAMI